MSKVRKRTRKTQTERERKSHDASDSRRAIPASRQQTNKFEREEFEWMGFSSKELNSKVLSLKKCQNERCCHVLKSTQRAFQ